MVKTDYGVQLYTLRKYTQTVEGIAKTFENMRKIGCKLVQMSGACEINSMELNKIASKNNIKIGVTHSPFERIVNDLDNLIKEHKNYNCKIIGLGSMPAEYRDEKKKVEEFCGILNSTSKKLAAVGMSIAYHNHAFEFTNLIEGKPLYDFLIDNTSKEVGFILDTYWVKFANCDIISYMDKLNGRLPVLHLKDYKKRFGMFPTMRELGRGELDFKEIAKKGEQIGVLYSVFEQDISRNPLKSVSISWEYIKNNLMNK